MDTIPPYEIQHVIDIYNDKCVEFDRARYAIWTEVEEFLSTLQKGISILEVGCGNGKNMKEGYTWTGCDASEKLVDICNAKGLNVTMADACNLPYKDESFDAVMNIAMIHHLSTEKRRAQAISEMARVLKKNGNCFITVLKSRKSCNKTFELDGVKRYYHLFEEGELNGLVYNKLDIVSVSSNRLNWYYTLRKPLT